MIFRYLVKLVQQFKSVFQRWKFMRSSIHYTVECWL